MWENIWEIWCLFDVLIIYLEKIKLKLEFVVLFCKKIELKKLIFIFLWYNLCNL